MKKILLFLVLCSPALNGCVTLPEWDQTPPKQELEKTRGLGNDKVPVTADQINDENAPKQLLLLKDEVERAEREPVQSSPENN